MHPFFMMKSKLDGVYLHQEHVIATGGSKHSDKKKAEENQTVSNQILSTSKQLGKIVFERADPPIFSNKMSDSNSHQTSDNLFTEKIPKIH